MRDKSSRPARRATRSRSRAAARAGRDRVISASAAAKGFGALIDRVRSERAVYVVERGGAPVVQIGPVPVTGCTVADLVQLCRSHTPVDESYLAAVEAGVAFFNTPGVPVDVWER